MGVRLGLPEAGGPRQLEDRGRPDRPLDVAVQLDLRERVVEVGHPAIGPMVKA
jgi:hypothetical protein